MTPVKNFSNVDEAAMHWSKVPAVWLVIGIPAVAVTVGFVMLAISIASFDGVVVDDYYKLGKEINRVLIRDNYATENNITAKLDFNRMQQTLSVQLDSDKKVDLPDSIELNLLHPTQANSDIQVIVQRVAGKKFQGMLPNIPAGRWIAQLTTSDWRLSKTIRLPAVSDFLLEPVTSK